MKNIWLHLFLISFSVLGFQCTYTGNKTNPDLGNKYENIQAKQQKIDEEVLSKLWASSDFYTFTQYRFRSFEKALESPDSVINLALYMQGMGELPSFMDTFRNVQLIGLDNNNLNSLPDEMGNLTYLQKIHLNKNKFTAFPEVLVKNRYLKTILISDNQIETVTPEIKNLAFLEDLVLNDNQLGIIPDAVFGLKSLKVLGLRNNGLTTLPDKFHLLPNLEKLNLEGNDLKELPESVSGLSLKRLTLKGNPMDYAYVRQLAEKMPDTEIEF